MTNDKLSPNHPVLDMVSYSRSVGFPENLATQPELFEAAGFSDYNWGAAAVYLIATEKYLEK